MESKTRKRWSNTEKALLRKLFKEAKRNHPDAQLRQVIGGIAKQFPNRTEKQVIGAMTNYIGNWSEKRLCKRQYVLRSTKPHTHPVAKEPKPTWHLLFNNGVELIGSDSPSAILALLNDDAVKNLKSIRR